MAESKQGTTIPAQSCSNRLRAHSWPACTKKAVSLNSRTAIRAGLADEQ